LEKRFKHPSTQAPGIRGKKIGDSRIKAPLTSLKQAWDQTGMKLWEKRIAFFLAQKLKGEKEKFKEKCEEK